MDNLSADEKKIGQDNFNEAVGFTRREFLNGVIAAGAVSGAGLGAMYYGYKKVSDPVRVGVIGTGDEGNVLLGGCTPDYVQVVAIADARPSSIHRAFHGDWSSPAAIAARPGLIQKAGYISEDDARKTVKVYTGPEGIGKLLDDKDIEAVIIALPLHLHAPIAVQAMKRGKHVLTEKLMAHDVAQCKAMSRIAGDNGTYKDAGGNPLHLATGHQRHYSVLYDNAVHLIQWGLLGQLHHIRAQWNRGNLPGNDSWSPEIPGGSVGPSGEKIDELAIRLKKLERNLKDATKPIDKKMLEKQVALWVAKCADKNVDAEALGYMAKKLGNGRERSAMEELIRWRLWDRTGGGLMAELGSHQMDAASIFCSALRKPGEGKAHPLTVHAIGNRSIFPNDREVEDHVYCSFEFPGPEYDGKFDVGYPTVKGNNEIPSYSTDPNKKIVVSYSTINGNGFGGYGEVVMGTTGTMILEKEQDIMLYADSDTSSSVGVKAAGGGYALDTQASGGSAAPIAKAAVSGPISRGYTEEIEHWAYCIRNPDPENRPRCYPKVAMGDAVISLTTNVAIQNGMKGGSGFIKFDEKWFEIDSDETPDGSNVKETMAKLLSYKV